MNRRNFLMLAAALPLLPARAPALAGTAFWNRVFSGMPPELAALARNPEYRVQVLAQYRTHASQPWQTARWQLTPGRWFSTASVAKLPIALLACEKTAALGLGLDAGIGFTQPPIGGEWPADEPDFETLSRTLNRIFTVSENPPFNRLYDFLGVDAMQARLDAMGYPSARLISRMSAPVIDNARTRAGQVRDGNGTVVFEFPERVGTIRASSLAEVSTGRGFLSDDGVLIAGPHDFSKANFIALADSQQMLKALVDADSVPPAQRWAIPEPMRQELLAIMTRMPRQSIDPGYDPVEYYDGYARFFMIGDSKAEKPQSLHLIGKSGEAYGFLTDVSFITETGSDLQLLLAANIYVNADGIFNDDVYEYESIGYPFLAALGRAVWRVINREA
jgi:Beta-lactamase enzyme family